LVLPCVALAGVANTAVAADLVVNKGGVVPTFTWAGFYVGTHAGYIWDDPELVATANANLSRGFVTGGGGPGTPAQAVTVTSVSPPGSLNDTSGHRFNGGVQLGYNLQSGIWVYGAETDISAGRRRIGTNATASGTIPCARLDPATGVCQDPIARVAQTMTTSSFAEATVDWYGTLRARLGVARDRWLAYATGGLAYGTVKVTNTGNFNGFTGTIEAAGANSFGLTSVASDSKTKVGWAASVGGAYAWSDTVSVFVEWTRVNLGTRSVFTAIPPTQLVPTAGGAVYGTAISDVTVQFDTINVGLNVKI
jgi:outer membrane immunogenic protein